MAITKVRIIASLFLAAVLSLPAFADANTNANRAVPGSINYVEGQVAMGAEPLNSKSIGSAELQTGESLNTEKGKAEILLTPGVFLRVGDNSSVRMISPELTNTEVAVDKGHAMVEVAQIYPQNDIRITQDGATARLLKTGLYDFDSRQNQFRVFDGKASVEVAGKDVTVKGGRDLSLAQNSSPKARKFDRKSYEEGDLYRFSSLRSAYLAEANVNQAGFYAANGWGPWGWNGWYWDPWFSAYTFVPLDGIWYSPFGWGFYSPWYVYQAPFFGFGFGYGGFGYGFHPHYLFGDRAWESHSPYLASNYAHGIYRGPGSIGRGFHSASGFRSGPKMTDSRSFGASGGGGFRGGGFHDGGGGFHGGGGGRGGAR
ncbi:MAG: FecR domain-containing protein [Terriglobales bacterium]